MNGVSALNVVRSSLTAPAITEVRSGLSPELIASYAGTYIPRRGWEGNAAVQRGVELIAQAREGLVPYPVINRLHDSAQTWLADGGAIPKGFGIADNERFHELNSLLHSSDPHPDWFAVQLLPKGPLEDALRAVERPSLGQTRWGQYAFVQDPKILDTSIFLRRAWCDEPPIPATMSDLDAYLFDVLLSHREVQGPFGPEAAPLRKRFDEMTPDEQAGLEATIQRIYMAKVTPESLVDSTLEPLGVDGIRQVLASGEITTKDTGTVNLWQAMSDPEFMKDQAATIKKYDAKPVTGPEGITEGVSLRDTIAFVNDAATPDEAADVMRAAEARGIPTFTTKRG